MRVALIVDPKRFSFSTLQAAIERAGPGGSVDIVILQLPELLVARELTIRRLYAHVGRVEGKLAKQSDVNVTVVVGVANKNWDLILVPEGTAFLFDAPSETVSPGQTEDVTVLEPGAKPNNATDYGVGAVGGTFDHLHRGHKLLLSLASLAVRFKLIVGITGPKLLENKKYAEALESYEKRESNVRAFLKYVRPQLEVETHAIDDIYGPTATEEYVDCLIVSQETLGGAAQINEMRRKRGWNELAVVEIGLIPGGGPEGKLSSTDLRRQELETKTRSNI